MKGDFSRLTFDPSRHFTRVLLQQGRVLLDADWNEQAAIILHYLQSLAADLIGPHGGPGDGFKIILGDENKFDFKISAGHYYVDGILCENDTQVVCSNQSDLPDYQPPTGNCLVYLDVWERHITCIEENVIREIALGGPDTTTRAKVVWQVKVESGKSSCDAATWKALIENWQPANRGALKVKGKQPPKKATDPCLISAEAKYRGAENHLYRVEVHRSGTALDDDGTNKDSAATFKWSRDNGSVVFPIRTLQGNTVTLAHLGLEEQRSLQVGQWVEIMDDNLAKRGEAGPYLQVESIDAVEKTAILIVPPDITLPVYDKDDPRHPLLRRWDSGLINIAENVENKDINWIDLEDGINIQFQPKASGNDHFYRVGDYWLIPARTATGDVEWPMKETADDKLVPVAQPPHGVEHHYAPLAIIKVDANGGVTQLIEDCRCIIEPPVKCPTAEAQK